MLELKDFDGKVLVSYLREPDTYSAVLDWTILVLIHMLRLLKVLI